MSNPTMGDLVKTIRPKKTEIMYVKGRDGTLLVFDRPSCITKDLNNPTLKTYAKYLPIYVEHDKAGRTYRVFKQPIRELFKNNQIFKF